MKKFLRNLIFVLAILTVIYTTVSFFLIRGLGIYRLGTTVGRVLASSWQYTGLVAFVLVICTAIILVKSRMKGEQKISAASPQSEDGIQISEQSVTHEKKKKQQKKNKSAVSGGTIPPTEAQPTVKIPPAAPVSAETERLAEHIPDTTELLPTNKTVPIHAMQSDATTLLDIPAGDATPPLNASVAEATMFLPTNALEQTVLPSEETIAPQTAEVPQQSFCPQCGVAAKPGAKFCVKCGNRLGG